MSQKIWVYIDHFKGKVLPISWEMITAGKIIAEKLGCNVTAIVLGYKAEGVARDAFYYGADEVIIVDNVVLEDFRSEPYADQLAQLAKNNSPEVIIFPTTTRGRELAAMLSVDLNTGVVPDIVGIDVIDSKVIATRSIYGGKVIVKVVCNAKPQIITIRSHIFEKLPEDKSLSGNLTRIENIKHAESFSTNVVDNIQSEGGVSLVDAKVIVTGGKGVTNTISQIPPQGLEGEEAEMWLAKQGFSLITELANLLNGAVGASRSAVDAGYVSYEHQVGQTGKIVSPELYFACGVSGSIQHLAGMRNSKVVVAINNDADAPIFKFANYGVCSDLYEVLPALINALKKKLGK